MFEAYSGKSCINLNILEGKYLRPSFCKQTALYMVDPHLLKGAIQTYYIIHFTICHCYADGTDIFVQIS